MLMRLLSLSWLLFYLSALQAQPVTVQEVTAIRLPVSQLTRSVNFFTEVLDFIPMEASPVKRSDRSMMRLKLGNEVIELVEYHTPGRAMPPDSRSNDRWFQHIAIIVRDMDAAYRRLQTHHVKGLSVAPQKLPDWNPQAGGIAAYYFADPDGHPLEILHFPSGKGQDRWHEKTDKLFLGIDHTAIVVGNTAASLRFYQDQLSMRIVGRSENYGLEQERLNNVPGARVRITTLRASAGPAIELLEYLEPRTGRPMPPDTKPQDLWRWQIMVKTKTPFGERSDPDRHVIGEIGP
jgi:catechol 2,3-dioxygenase-like lactoylglutathione lyase family enzyme